MDFLVLSPPVLTPSEPPSGAFMLAAGLKGQGARAGLLDLSLAFFHTLFSDVSPPQQSALDYLRNSADGYEPMKHRSETGHLHCFVSGFEARHPGWKLTLMDIAPPGRVHHPGQIDAALERGHSPFLKTFDTHLQAALTRYKPEQVLISVAYLSQLPGAIDLVRYLRERGVAFRVGGSLINSLATTGHGFDIVQQVLGALSVGDGRELIPGGIDAPLLHRLAWPTMVLDAPYLSSHPVIPLSLSSGCYWNRCLFCPDREMPYSSIPMAALEQFLSSIPDEVMAKRPVLHLLDSAIPPGRLRQFLPMIESLPLGFFGFARPTRKLLDGGLLRAAADAGCLMLQLGAEGGSRTLLDRYQKGIDPAAAEAVVRGASESGIRTYLYMLFGLPKETHEDLRMTSDFLCRNGEFIDFLNLSLFNLPRYCELMSRAEAFDIQVLDFPGEEGIRLYRPFLSRGVDQRRQAREHLKKMRAVPEIREAILRTPRWFRAAHLALMNIPGRYRVAP